MKIVVFLKQVPDTQKVKIDPVRGTLIRKGVPSVTNPFDESALELALELKEISGGTVTALTMGIPDSKEILYDAMVLGADEAVLITGSDFAGSDTLATAYVLSKAVQSLGSFDLYLFGKQATDGDTAQVGPEVASHLGVPVVAFVQTVLQVKNGLILVERMIEKGTQTVEVGIPAVLTVVKAQKRLRMPCLSGIIRSFGKPLKRFGAVDIGVDTSKCGLVGSPTRVKKIFSPKHQSKVRFIEGGREEMARGFIEMLKQEGVLGG
jgi:electron transfer flavoprotein beta subunit